MIFFFNDTATTEIYTLSLHDALPICRAGNEEPAPPQGSRSRGHSPYRLLYPFPLPLLSQHHPTALPSPKHYGCRSEEHTSELQSRQYLVCRLLLEKKNQQ